MKLWLKQKRNEMKKKKPEKMVLVRNKYNNLYTL